MACCASSTSSCVLVHAAPWCSGAHSEAACHNLHTEYHPCIWRGLYCTKGNKSGCPPPAIPTVTLNTGARMPMLAYGTGMLPMNSVAKPGRRGGGAALRDRSAIPFVNVSLELGYTHVDTSEMYPGFDELGALLRPHRHRIFLTTKVDPTLRQTAEACRADGIGCNAAMLAAANATVRRLGTVPDLLLLHRPPPRQGLGTGAQCRRLVASWRGLEEAQHHGFARAIGLSNVCGSLLRCLSRFRLQIKPAVVQYMHHVGMGPDPMGYKSFAARAFGSVYMAYSVLGGVSAGPTMPNGYTNSNARARVITVCAHLYT